LFPKYVVSGVLVSLLASQAFAATPADEQSAAQQLQLLQQEQQLRQLQQFQEDSGANRQRSRIDADIPQANEKEGGPCQNIRDIQLQGVTLFRATTIRPVIQPYMNRCLNVSQIEGVMTKVTALYISRGYVAARAYLAPQDISTGVLKLVVVEGQLESIVVDDGDKNTISLFNTFAGKQGGSLNLRDVEQAVDQINRLQSNDVVTHIAPGKEAGGSVLSFENKATKPWHVNVAYDNHGSKSTGKEQAGVTGTYDNVFGWNDSISATYRQTALSHKDQFAKTQTYTYTVPFSYTTVALNASLAKFSSPLHLPSGVTLISEGESKNYSMRVDRNLYRDRDSIWNVAASITNKDTENYLADVFLAVSSRRLTVVDIDTSYMFPLLGGMATLSGGYAEGTSWLDALKDASDIAQFQPHAQFTKWKYGAGYMHGFKMAGQQFTVNSNLTGQYGDDALYGSEQVLIGGIYTVRGFSDNTLTGDHGFYVRNDIAMPYQLPSFYQLPMSIRPYIGLDYGRVTSINHQITEGEFAGAALGVGYSLSTFYMDVFISHAIDKPKDVKSEGALGYFRLSYNF